MGRVPAPDVSLAPRRRGSAYAQTRPPSQPAQRALANFPRPEPARVYTCSRYNRKRTSTRSHLPLGCWRVPRSRVRVSTGSAAASPRDCRPQPWGSVLTTPRFGGALAGPPVLVYTSSATPGHRRCFGSRAPPAPPMALETLQSADPAEIPRSRCTWPVPAVAPGSRPRRNCRGCLPGPRPHAPVRAAPPPLSHILRYRRWRKKCKSSCGHVAVPPPPSPFLWPSGQNGPAAGRWPRGSRRATLAAAGRGLGRGGRGVVGAGAGRAGSCRPPPGNRA